LEGIPQEVVTAPVHAVTSGRPHFFGYYDKCPWSPDGSHLLAGEADFQDRPPTPADRLRLGTIDLATGAFEVFAETTAWSWQQGAMLQWVPGSPSSVVANARRDDGSLGAVVRDLAGGRTRWLDRPIYALSPNGHDAVSLDFHRIQTCRPGYGYPPGEVLEPPRWAPDDDGVWHLDVTTGRSRLVVSLAELAAFEPDPRVERAPSYVNHAGFDPTGSRLCFFHLWSDPAWVYEHTGRWFTVAPDGADLFLLSRHDIQSHFDWRDEHTLLGWAMEPLDRPLAGPYGHWYEHQETAGAYWLYRDRTHDRELFAEAVLPHDGHMSFSPDRRWIVTDEYSVLPGNDGTRPLLLFEIATGRRLEVARFAEPLEGELRCDLHPRWSRDGRQVCVDSSHEGTRQVYIVDVSGIVG